MKYINEEKIKNLLTDASGLGSSRLDSILDKARSLQRLSLHESAALLSVKNPEYIRRIFEAASFVKDTIYGRRVVLFAPLYISNLCANSCCYCAFKSDNRLIKRKALDVPEIKTQTEWLLRRGHKRILMVCGEAAPGGKSNVDYYIEAVKAIYAAAVGKNKIKRVNVNCAPLSVDDFKKLKASGIGTYQIFQESYHQETYLRMHPAGPKSDPDNRIEAVDRAFKAGIDDIGIGALYGLFDWRFETLGLLSHIEHMEESLGVGPHTISVPRIEPAEGAEMSLDPPYKLTDEEFKKVVAVLRLSVPYTGIIMSTRESARMRDELLNLGVSQISAESNTSPGGYSVVNKEQASMTAEKAGMTAEKAGMTAEKAGMTAEKAGMTAEKAGMTAEKAGSQFSLGDHRSLDQIVGALINYDYIPSFCAACYRMERTGETFMQLAKPGTIKGKCSMNALITLKEYLDDFASKEVKGAGYKMIARYFRQLDRSEQERLKLFFAHVDSGVRDEYV
ncbi:MAG: [FeFe] hydrogenase H-cluster radical SAM maturase HydG [Candidatus Omnitrophica bacterium]|nr:[FeFe] hydrogenase H-cluster radical SAM maturase HydG [Candidatus Omnitrophota bacterium]